MTARAVGPFALSRDRADPAALIFSCGNRLEMFGSDAGMITTQVIYLESKRDRTDHLFIHETVRVDMSLRLGSE